MEWQNLFNIAASFIVFLLGWFVRLAYDATIAMKEDITQLERTVSNHYVRREDYKQDIREIKEMLVLINAKMDNKVDKGDLRLHDN
jgi:hypothetical protein